MLPPARLRFLIQSPSPGCLQFATCFWTSSFPARLQANLSSRRGSTAAEGIPAGVKAIHIQRCRPGAQGTSDNLWRHFSLSHFGGVGVGVSNAQDRPLQQRHEAQTVSSAEAEKPAVQPTHPPSVRPLP